MQQRTLKRRQALVNSRSIASSSSSGNMTWAATRVENVSAYDEKSSFDME